MVTKRLLRTLSAFNRSTRRWEPISSRSAQSHGTLSLISWNLDAFSSRPVSRAKLLLGHILERSKCPDIILFQEVTPGVRDSLLDDARVRAAFLVSDAEDQTAFEGVPFTTMVLLSNATFASGLNSRMKGEDFKGGQTYRLGSVFRVTLPSKYGRDALYVDIIPLTAPDTFFRLINVHLDSLEDALRYRVQQIEILVDVLRDAGCSGGIIAGDFNAISPDDDGLVAKSGLVDAWVMLHQTNADPADGATWGVVGRKRRDGLRPGRLDKFTTLGLLKAKEIEIVRPGTIEAPRPGEQSIDIPWSDHCGLRCTFTI